MTEDATAPVIQDSPVAGQERLQDLRVRQTLSPRGLWRDAWLRLRRDRFALLGGLIILGLVAVAIFASWLAPHSPTRQFRDGLALGQPVPPSAKFLLGTDNLGRDILSRLIWGARVSLLVGILGNGLAVLIGILVGTAAGFVGGWVETILMRSTDVIMGFPVLLLAVALISVLRPGLNIVILVIGLVYWTYLARIVYGYVKSLRERDFVLAARSIGCTTPRILFRHLLPHVVSLAIVYLTLGTASAIILESTLSFIGIGIQPPTASWGNMISDGQRYYRAAPWLVIYPSLALMLTVLGFNLMGDGLRDALDPQQRR
ncbi:MAG: ABC transporter permease [Anaerolineae bacterium]|nr:ABC transporter permease [Anaerolineae bacterium]